MSMVPFVASEMPVPDPVPAVWMEVLEYFSLYPLAHRLKSGYSRVLPVSVTWPPDGFSTPPEGSLAAAPAAVLRTTELSASPAAATAITPRRSRVALISFVTGSLLVMCGWLVLLWVIRLMRLCVCAAGPTPRSPDPSPSPSVP